MVSHAANWYYLTGFTGDAGVLIVGQGKTTLISDGRFTTQAHEETSSVRFLEQKGNLMDSAGRFLRGKPVKTGRV